jgi:hypothetical protein
MLQFLASFQKVLPFVELFTDDQTGSWWLKLLGLAIGYGPTAYVAAKKAITDARQSDDEE